jgi:hypothetical protein
MVKYRSGWNWCRDGDVVKWGKEGEAGNGGDGAGGDDEVI